MSHPLDIQPGDHILISRTDRLGDLVLALPFVETMKRRYPDCRIDVLASLYASPILEHNPGIDGIVRVQNDQMLADKLYKKDLLYRIRQGNYKVVVALYPERHICHLFYQAGIPIRLGTAGRFHSVLFNAHLFHSRKKNVKHEFQYNLDFLEFFKDGETVTRPKVYLQEKEIVHAKRLLEEANASGRTVVLHPGSGGSAERWPLEMFVKLHAELKSQGIAVVISGSEQEGDQIQAVSEQLQIPVRKITGLTDLRTLSAVLAEATVVVANSTGPLHLATAVGTRVVGLYPSRMVTSPQRWGPIGKYHRVVQPSKVNCSCPPKECQCMSDINISEVAQQVIELVKLEESVT